MQRNPDVVSWSQQLAVGSFRGAEACEECMNIGQLEVDLNILLLCVKMLVYSTVESEECRFASRHCSVSVLPSSTAMDLHVYLDARDDSIQIEVLLL